MESPSPFDEEKQVPGNQKVLVCLDIGTSGTGVAYNLPGTLEAVMFGNKNETAKSKSDVLLKRRWAKAELITPQRSSSSTVGDYLKWEVACFGDEAFNQGEDKRDDNDYVFIPSFKMLLYGNDLKNDPGIQAKKDVFVSAVDIFAAVMKFWKTRALHNLGSQTTVRYTDKDIQWIITVPAIWSGKAKAILRQAACKAGLCTDDDQEQQLIFSFEPEAASLSVRDAELKLVNSTLFKGKRIAVVDFGGGTTDMVVHEVKGDGLSLRDVTPADGIYGGGTLVNQEFVKFLKDLVGKDALEAFKKKETEEFNELVWNEFEQRKLENYDKSRIRFPSGLIPRGSTLPTLIEKYLKHFPREGLSASGNKLVISRQFFIDVFFKSVVNKNLKFIERVLSRPEVKDNWDYIFMVGGFAECSVLSDAVKTKFGPDKVKVPPKAGQVVVRGGILYGQQRSRITRMSMWTFGTNTGSKYDAVLHKGREVYFATQEGKQIPHVTIFDTYTNVGQELLPGNSKIERTFFPISDNQTEIGFSIYQSHHQTVQYPDSDGVKKIGFVSLKIPMAFFDTVASSGRSRPIKLEMDFVETEIRVKAFDATSGNIVRATIDYMNTS
eukprot:gb/GEZN01003573.1/.p1 GENE.gb/GEZN01003573.1/~~gb/GEZN01003573.1/.p1  ORF type:complete len:607 (+),score=68.60 gb/GEZN01003573.1/:98-1918(+)